MSVISRVLSCAIICFIVAACAKNKGDAYSPAPKGGNPPQKVEPQNVVTTAELKTLRTDETIAAVQNPTSLKGEGAGNTYKAIYKFNSGSNTAFKLVSIKQKTSCSHGSAPQSKYYLARGSEAAEITVMSAVTLLPNTDYELWLVAGKHGCSELEIAYEVTAWADVANANFAKPEVARTCAGRDPGQLVFFMQHQPMMARASHAGWPVFLSMETFCGERITRQEKTCKWSLTPEVESVNCSAATNPESKMSVTFNVIQKQVAVSCSKGDSETYSGIYENCVDQILDLTTFDR